MSVRTEANGRRSVEVEFEVAGTPEQVWEALATGPGISSWFVPTDVEQQDGKPVAVIYHFGPGMDMRSTVTACERPRMFAQAGEGMTPGSPPMASEWSIEARAGGICVVRVVHSLFASTAEWDDQLEGAKGGWAGFLAILRVYLKHFAGQRCAITQVSMPVATSDAETWDILTSAMGLKGAKAGDRWSTPAGAPKLAGVVEVITEDPWDALLRLDQPGPGIAALGAHTYPGGQGMVAMNIYMYGDDARDTIDRLTPVWEAWFQERFTMPTETAT